MFSILKLREYENYLMSAAIGYVIDKVGMERTCMP